ncbi:hypothetical protein [Luteibaculum oceani]|uniref:Outer membrane beta-barrel protein n=1 Tax=Luteibaculum oceani TaxID=1294296 RepID=A0A5C6V993_9FLAO|nr:hypothetical protein [Luteibaculum oceani]TXC81697.1 hypothetical protein FRX97_04050 [Luteibaculum oceani]
MIKKIGLVASLIFITATVFGQDTKASKTESFPEISINFGTFIPAADYDEYFGTHFQIGGKFAYKTLQNTKFGLEGNFVFGNRVDSENMLKHVRTKNNEIIDEDGQLATVLFFQRGFHFLATGGKIFPKIWGQNSNSGLTAEFGLGYMQHKIRVENQNNRVPFIDGEYEKGYDRLTNGLVLKQSIGITHYSNNKLANFYVNFEMYEGFTKNRRDYNFDLDGPDKRARLDLAFGIKFGWIFLLQSRISNEYYID